MLDSKIVLWCYLKLAWSSDMYCVFVYVCVVVVVVYSLNSENQSRNELHMMPPPDDDGETTLLNALVQQLALYFQNFHLFLCVCVADMRYLDHPSMLTRTYPRERDSRLPPNDSAPGTVDPKSRKTGHSY